MNFGIELSKGQKKMYQNLAIIRSLLSKALSESPTEIQKQPSATSPQKRMSDETSDVEQEHEVISHLKKGYIMTKHSQNSKPKSKFVYLSMNEKFLCWKSVDKLDQKKLQISSISRIVRNNSQFLLKKDKYIKNIDNCIVIIAQSRDLFLQASTDIDATYFQEDMLRAMKYCQKMSLNYLYTNQ